MPINPERLSPIEKELRFLQWTKDVGVERFLIDLDDTICPTGAIFRDKMSDAYAFLGENAPIMSAEAWGQELVAIDNQLFEVMGVNPDRWGVTLDELSKRFPIGEDVAHETKLILESIYDTPLTIFEEAEKGLSFFKKTNTEVGIVTHASREWTWKKYNWLDLKRFLEWDEVFVVNANGHKTSESWHEAIRYFGLEVEHVAMAGDSPRSDINPAREIGVKHCFLIEDSQQWSVHNQPVDEYVKKVNSLIEIPDVVIREYWG